MFKLTFMLRNMFCKRISITFLLVFFAASCTVTESTLQGEVEYSATGSIESIDPVESPSFGNHNLTPTPTQYLQNTVPVTITPPLTTHENSENLAPEGNFLKGPLVGFRGLSDIGDVLVILDINSSSYRTLSKDISHPFGELWFNNGCELYVSNGLVDLNGELIWQLPNLDWARLLVQEGAFSKTMLISPDKQWAAYDIMYGEQFFEESEFRDIGIVNLSDPSNPIFLTTDGRANRFSWSPDALWLVYKNVDQNGISQLFRFSPYSNEIEQMTFHTERLGIGYIVWSPNGRYIAYATYQSDDQGATGVGWVDIVDVQTLNLFRIVPQADNFGGVYRDEIWWSVDGMRLLFSGRDWENSAASTQIYWVDVPSNSITDSYFASDVHSARIDEVYAVGGVDHILFSTDNEFYLLNGLDKSYERISFDPNVIGQRYETESAPFSFSGEENCIP